MSDELTLTGLSIDDYETRRAAVVSQLRSEISATLDCSPDQPTGQLVDILLERVQAALELLQSIHSATDPDQATGQSLDGVSSITGTYRREATHSTVVLTLSLDAVTIVGAGSIAAVTGDPTNQWVLTEDVASVAAGNYDGQAEAVEAGPVAAAAGTITTIVTAVPGWTAVTNAADAAEGSDVESDTSLRLRRELEVVLGGSTSAGAIRAAVNQLDGVLECYCYENTLPVAVAPMPPHSIELVYWDGGAGAADVDEIAETVWEEKAAGVHAYGSAYVAYTDDGGNDYQIGMTLADEQVITVEVTATVTADYVAGTIEAAVAAIELGIGDDVYRAEVIAAAMDVLGVENVTLVRLAVFPAAVANVDLAITARQIATIGVGDVTVI